MFIYFIQAGGTGGPMKIGISKDPEKRLKALQVGSHELLKIIYKKNLGGEAENMELFLHEKFKNFRIRGEWFRPDREIYEVIEKFKGG